jgi:hypothetical protein
VERAIIIFLALSQFLSDITEANLENYCKDSLTTSQKSNPRPQENEAGIITPQNQYWI